MCPRVPLIGIDDRGGPKSVPNLYKSVPQVVLILKGRCQILFGWFFFRKAGAASKSARCSLPKKFPPFPSSPLLTKCFPSLTIFLVFRLRFSFPPCSFIVLPFFHRPNIFLLFLLCFLSSLLSKEFPSLNISLLFLLSSSSPPHTTNYPSPNIFSFSFFVYLLLWRFDFSAFRALQSWHRNMWPFWHLIRKTSHDQQEHKGKDKGSD